MATVNERSLGVARLYARAMLTVADEQGAAHTLADELGDLVAHAHRDEAFGRFLASPVLERGRRRESLERMLRGRASDLLVDSLQVINQKNRLAILDQILAAYHAAHRELLGQVEVYVSTAVPLSDEQRTDIRGRATRYTGKEVLLVERVDADLLGGVIVQIGDQKVDMSVRRDLELLASRFAARLSKEMLGGRRFGLENDAAAGQAGGPHDGRDEEP